MTTAKVKFLFGYNVKIVIVWGTKLWWGNKDLVEKRSLLGVTFPARVWANFLDIGGTPFLSSQVGLSY